MNYKPEIQGIVDQGAAQEVTFTVTLPAGKFFATNPALPLSPSDLGAKTEDMAETDHGDVMVGHHEVMVHYSNQDQGYPNPATFMANIPHTDIFMHHLCVKTEPDDGVGEKEKTKTIYSNGKYVYK